MIPLPVREMRNWESESDSSLIPFTIPLIPIPVPIPPKYPHGTRIAILWNRNRATSTLFKVDQNS